MLKNENCETQVCWSWINEDRAVNFVVSEMIIAALKRSKKPDRVCKILALDIEGLAFERLRIIEGKFEKNMYEASLLRVNFAAIARAVMHEVIFGEEVAQ